MVMTFTWPEKRGYLSYWRSKRQFSVGFRRPVHHVANSLIATKAIAGAGYVNSRALFLSHPPGLRQPALCKTAATA